MRSQKTHQNLLNSLPLQLSQHLIANKRFSSGRILRGFLYAMLSRENYGYLRIYYFFFHFYFPKYEILNVSRLCEN